VSLALAHAGLAVPDLARAVEWYGRALGCTVMHGPVRVPGHDAQVRDVLGKDVGDFRQAHLRTPGGLVLELFELGAPARYEGLFHLCLLAPDIALRAEAIVEAGGRRTSRLWPHRPGAASRLCYCADPFGNVIELSTHADAEVYGG
jgi:catechol 2,3-dioxygenase-like lactoylglutathione lyase family enzyme